VIRLVAFDLDDTLYPEREFVFSGFRAVDAYLVGHYRIKNFFPEAEKLFDEGERLKIFDRALANLGRAADGNLIRELVDIYRSHKPAIMLPDESREILEVLSAKRLSLALITDGYLATQQNKVSALGLEHWISCIICTDQWGRDCWKPSTKSYRHAMTHFAMEPEECVYVGDNPVKDFFPALQLGWKTVRYRTPDGIYSSHQAQPGCEANIEITSLTQLANCLDNL
jgi:putative hydrolase of the HAD superfamily